MPRRLGPEESSFILRFGGGLSTRATEADIDERECSSGQNYQLDIKNDSFRPRLPFDLVGTTPNAGQINGFINLRKSDGTTSFLVQSDDTVYEWDGSSFTSRGTVSSSSRLRGTLQQNWQLDDKVIITDLALEEVVMEWDGTTLQDVTFTTEDGSTAFGTFKARYCVVRDERAIFANVADGSGSYPHLIIGAERGDYTVITVNNRPSSSLSDADPYFLIQPDYRYINGLTAAFGVITTSSRDGSLFNLTGSSAKDFAFEELYPFSGISGNEAMTNIGNDVLYGRQGRLESLISTDKFGDTETDDISLDISDQIEDYKDWTIVYNARTQLVYCYPDAQAEIWVLNKPMTETNLSPWVIYRTKHDMNMNPTAMMNAYHPTDGLEYVFFGDDSGNVYRMEGTAGGGDGGTEQLKVNRLSKLITLPIDSEAYNFNIWASYRKKDALTVKCTFWYQGYQIFSESITFDIQASERNYYSGGAYYSGGYYYASRRFQFKKEKLGIIGKGDSFQIELEVEDENDFEIQEIGIRFGATSS